MWPDRVSNPRPLTYESGALPIALRGPANSDTDVDAKTNANAGGNALALPVCLYRQAENENGKVVSSESVSIHLNLP